jgi:ketosteroid isomerase-like protein
MTREDYDRYVAAFNARDYDAVFDFYAEHPKMAFFGIEITSREQFMELYGFMHR